MLAAVESGLTVAEYSPAEIKRALVGYGRAEKHQVAEMIRLLLHLDVVPTPHDASDALAVAICHLHAASGAVTPANEAGRVPRSWRHWRPPAGTRPS
jgi:crossover junction endodeoxyribonuclease RuvC